MSENDHKIIPLQHFKFLRTNNIVVAISILLALILAVSLLLFESITLAILSSIILILNIIGLYKHVEHTNKIENHALCSEIVNGANTAIVRFSTDGEISFVNSFAENLFEYPSSEIIGENIFSILKPHLTPKHINRNVNQHAWMNALKNRITTNSYFELWNVSKSDKNIFMGWTTKPIIDNKKKIKEFIAIGSDKTEHKLMLDKFQQNQKKFRDIFDTVNDGIIIISKNGDLLEQNNAILKNFGITRQQISSDTQLKTIFRKLVPNLETLIKTVFEKKEVMFDHVFNNIDGEKMTIEIRANLINYEGQDAVLAVGRNVVNLRLDQQRVFNAALEAEERERSRIAKELHDSVSPILSTIKLYIQSLRDAKEENIIKTILDRTEDSINDTIKTVTEISNNLSPHVLENFGLMDAIKTFSEKIELAYNISINIVEKISFRPSKNIEIALYRVTTELINNTIKYANANKVDITVIQNQDFIMLKYTDNGKGFDKNLVQKQTKGMGLYNIINRLKSINGNIDYTTEPGKGILVKIHVPLKA